MDRAWYMSGTEESGEYVVILHTRFGRVGYRELGGSHRIRVEPGPAASESLARTLSRADHWKQPGDQGQNRYSIVVEQRDLVPTLTTAIRALKPGGADTAVNPSIPSRFQELVKREIAAPDTTTRGLIFISYRRSDSQGDVGRMHDWLLQRFPVTMIFRDVSSIPIGTSFPEMVDDALDRATVGLVVIGPNWTLASSEGKRRIDDPSDLVRREVETLLKANIPTIPCLVSNAVLPRNDDLPESLRSLLSRQATQVRPDPDFGQDMNRLTERLVEVLAAKYL